MPSGKTTFQAGMCMKTNRRTRCQVPGVRCQGVHPDSQVQARGLATVRSEKPTFQAGMCLKTNDRVRSPRFEVRSRKASAAGAPVLTPGSLLLTPVLQEMKVQPEMLLKTHDREHGTREHGVRGVKILASFLKGTPARVEPGAHASVTGYPGNMLKTNARQNQITHHKSLFANALAPYS